MKSIKCATLLLAALMVTLSCSGSKSRQNNLKEENEVSQNRPAAAADGKILIVYFSHAGENYSVGNVKVGNTRLVAEEVQKLTGGDLFEIVAEKNYDMPYERLTRVAKEESEKGELPAFKGEVKNIEQYDTVFVGGPIWWGTYPQVMFTFFKKYNLDGKTIIPFTTHEGSGLGNVVGDLKECYPKANITKAFSIAGHNVRGGMDKVDKWVRGVLNP